jgi:hypothetical protein
VTILVATLSNKPQYLPDALAGLDRQTRRDFRHVLRLDSGDWSRGYPPSIFFNEQLELNRDCEYAAWLSDDDVWYPNYLEVLAGYLDAHPGSIAAYAPAKHVLHRPGKPDKLLGIYPYGGSRPVWDSKHLPCGGMDGGQVLFRTSVLRLMGKPWAPEDIPHAHASDGLFLNKLAKLGAIELASDEIIMDKRTTELSAFTYAEGGQMRSRQTYPRG